MFIYGFDRTRKWSIALLVLACVAVVFMGSSCTGASGNTSGAHTQTVEAASLDLLIQEYMPDWGFQVLLIPKDENGLLFKAEGNVNAEIWLQSGEGAEAPKEQLLCEWNDIYLTKEDYTQFLGASIPLEWGIMYILGGGQAVTMVDVYCTLEVTLTMPSGKTLFAVLTDIDITIEQRCC